MTPTRAFRIPAVLLERIDAARGQRTRTAFLIEALEAYLVGARPTRNPAGEPDFTHLDEEARETGLAEKAGELARRPPSAPAFQRPRPSAEVKAGIRPL